MNKNSYQYIVFITLMISTLTGCKVQKASLEYIKAPPTTYQDTQMGKKVSCQLTNLKL